MHFKLNHKNSCSLGYKLHYYKSLFHKSFWNTNCNFSRSWQTTEVPIHFTIKQFVPYRKKKERKVGTHSRNKKMWSLHFHSNHCKYREYSHDIKIEFRPAICHTRMQPKLSTWCAHGVVHRHIFYLPTDRPFLACNVVFSQLSFLFSCVCVGVHKANSHCTFERPCARLSSPVRGRHSENAYPPETS